jgi:hypothetical protein
MRLILGANFCHLVTKQIGNFLNFSVFYVKEPQKYAKCLKKLPNFPNHKTVKEKFSNF